MSEKIAITVSEMARMVGLSRARFYQLMKAGVFPQPVRIESNSRPYYDQYQQEVCLRVKRTNCGLNGQPVLFYTRRPNSTPIKKRATKEKPSSNHIELLEGLRSLGLTTVTASQVQEAMAKLYTNQTPPSDQGELLRSVFLSIKRSESSR